MKTLDFLTDLVSMVAVVLVGIATTSYLSVSITPDVWSKIIMGIFGGGLPLISVRFLIKKKMRLFWTTVCLIVFCDVSMVLSLTASQAHESIGTPSGEDQTPAPLKRLQKSTDAAQKNLDTALEQQAIAKTRGTLDNLDEQIKAMTASRDEARKQEAAWTPTTRQDVVSSHDVFMAIPVALASLDLSRYMTLVFALLVAIVYQGTVFATVKATVRSMEKTPAVAKKARKRIRATKKAATATPSKEDFQPEETLVPSAGGMTEVL